MTAVDVSNAVSEAQAAGGAILGIIGAAAPGVALSTDAAAVILTLAGDLVTKALTAFSAASGEPITAESILALLPNPTPLSAPDAA